VRLKQQFLNFSDQLMLRRTFIQSRGLHLFPTSRACTALLFVSFFLFYIKQVPFGASKQLQYSHSRSFWVRKSKDWNMHALYAK